MPLLSPWGEPFPAALTLYFDGLCEPNPGGIATYGFAVRSGLNVLHAGYGLVADGGKLATNNVAEYVALGKGLRWLNDAGWTGELTIHGDSKLVIHQLKREWTCNAEHLQPLLKRCHELLDKIDRHYRAVWIRREDNEHCDGLSRMAYDEYRRQRKGGTP